ncbi:hypothetical protein N7509_010113 [Penicillium cosmopolitanum]|uniref:Uncharacterized protein n=1 Tax=Penicillium cosmopolitanum TaxID=1131564 RepID=A0A9W9VQQ0_9EURO|nr:uncharacterized protein N7509_010113 [Penicillium cosmopolitanum]KAJ5387572.1 hypothetical protein N7509_010113 [Penicillium cosmopolitanum]
MASPGTILELPDQTTPLVPESPDESWFVDQNSTIFGHMPSPGMHRQNQAALRSDGEHDREPGDDPEIPCLASPGTTLVSDPEYRPLLFGLADPMRWLTVVDFWGALGKAMNLTCKRDLQIH